MPLRILIAMDKFKGSLSAVEAGAAIERGLTRGGIDAEFTHCPIADGGEGFTEALSLAMQAERITTMVRHAQGRATEASYGLTSDGTAILEMSAASGLAKVLHLPLQPELASTFGTGELMRDALARGAKRIIIGIGGSATNDGGAGMAAALGVRFINAAGDDIMPTPERMLDIARIEGIGFRAEVLVACDVDNPLLGERGATAVYGRQKGVRDVAWFEQRLDHLRALVDRDLGRDVSNVPSAGAAGGLGFGLMAFCYAELVSGFDLVADVTQLSDRIAQADVVITGEGRIDSQTLFGKGPAGVAAMAAAQGKPIIGIGGSVEDSAEVRARFDLTIASKPPEMELSEAIRRGASLLEESVAPHAASIRDMAAARSRGSSNHTHHG
jgi:glycerate 2-kinase